MYPFLRLAKEMWVHRRAPALGPFDTHVSHHLCWPWDLDFFFELNNGRTLTLYDLGRIPLAARVGLLRVLRREGWGLAIAGASVRYRRRIRMFERLEMRSRAVGMDARFLYIEQSLWRGETCCSHILHRAAVTDKAGIVPTERVLAAWSGAGATEPAPELPDWVRAWTEADALRPWPPQMEQK